MRARCRRKHMRYMEPGKEKETMMKETMSPELKALYIDQKHKEIETFSESRIREFSRICNMFTEIITSEQQHLVDDTDEMIRDMYNLELEPLCKVFCLQYQLLRNTPESPETKNLKITLTIFERALEGLGIITYYPQPGESFDEILHTAMTQGTIVEECLTPGFKKTGRTGETVLLPAQVRLRKKEMMK